MPEISTTGQSPRENVGNGVTVREVRLPHKYRCAYDIYDDITVRHPGQHGPDLRRGPVGQLLRNNQEGT